MDWKIPFVSSIGELCGKVDGLLLLSVDARLRLQEVREAAACGKPVFVDKPLAASYADAEAVAALLDAKKVPWYSGSSDIHFLYISAYWARSKLFLVRGLFLVGAVQHTDREGCVQETCRNTL